MASILMHNAAIDPWPGRQREVLQPRMWAFATPTAKCAGPRETEDLESAALDNHRQLCNNKDGNVIAAMLYEYC